MAPERTNPDPAGLRRRILVIDDDELARAGVLATLEQGAVDLDLVPLSVAEAGRAPLAGVVAAVVEAVDPTARLDQVVGAAVVEHLRRTGPADLRIVVVCGVAADDAVRRRMAEAGADRYVHRSWARRGEDLLRAVLADDAPDLVVPPVRATDALERIGIGPATRVNLGVAAAITEGFASPASALGGRDRYARRVRFNQAARLRPVTADGSDSDRGELVPTIRQIQRFHAWAARVVAPTGADAPTRPTNQGEEPMDHIDEPGRTTVRCGTTEGDDR